MLKTVLFILLFGTIVFANDAKHFPISPYEQSINLLSNIQKDGIVLGSGERLVYVFVDPLCQYSRKFISMVTQDQNMVTKYKYIIFLYEIKRLNSGKTIYAIYNQKKPLETLLDVMLHNKKIEYEGDEVIDQRVANIAQVAQKLNVNKRPFLIIKQ